MPRSWYGTRDRNAHEAILRRKPAARGMLVVRRRFPQIHRQKNNNYENIVVPCLKGTWQTQQTVDQGFRGCVDATRALG